MDPSNVFELQFDCTLQNNNSETEMLLTLHNTSSTSSDVNDNFSI